MRNNGFMFFLYERSLKVWKISRELLQVLTCSLLNLKKYIVMPGMKFSITFSSLDLKEN